MNSYTIRGARNLMIIIDLKQKQVMVLEQPFCHSKRSNLRRSGRPKHSNLAWLPVPLLHRCPCPPRPWWRLQPRQQQQQRRPREQEGQKSYLHHNLDPSGEREEYQDEELIQSHLCCTKKQNKREKKESKMGRQVQTARK